MRSALDDANLAGLCADGVGRAGFQLESERGREPDGRSRRSLSSDMRLAGLPIARTMPAAKSCSPPT